MGWLFVRAGLLLQPHRKFGSGEGFADVKALDRIAPEVYQLFERFLVFDPLGHNGHPEVMSQFDRGADDHGITLIRVKAPDKRYVNF